MEQNKTDSDWDSYKEKKVGMDWPHTKEECIQHHQAGPGLESPRKEKGGTTKADLAEKYRQGNKSSRNDMGWAEEDLRKPSALEEFHMGSRGISEVSKW